MYVWSIHCFGFFHNLADEWSLGPLIVLAVVYHMMATATYGIMASSGVFIPALLIGGIWGRIVGMLVMQWLPGVVSCLLHLHMKNTFNIDVSIKYCSEFQNL